MAIYHLSMRLVRKAGGTLGRAAHHGGQRLSHGATGKAAYLSGTRMVDEAGVVTDYRNKAPGVEHSAFILPDGTAPVSREALWRAVDAHPTRTPNAVVARDTVVALPHEFTAAERVAVATEFATWVANRFGSAVELGLHYPEVAKGSNERNFHFHLMMSERRIERDGSLGAVNRDLNAMAARGDEQRGVVKRQPPVVEIREAWERIANAALARGGHAERVDHRTLREQGIERTPTEHRGAAATRALRAERAIAVVSAARVALELSRLGRNLRAREAAADARIRAIQDARKVHLGASVGASLGSVDGWTDDAGREFLRVMANLDRAERLRRQLTEIERNRTPLRKATQAEETELRAAGRERSRAAAMRKRVERLGGELPASAVFVLRERPGTKARLDEIERGLRGTALVTSGPLDRSPTAGGGAHINAPSDDRAVRPSEQSGISEHHRQERPADGLPYDRPTRGADRRHQLETIGGFAKARDDREFGIGD